MSVGAHFASAGNLALSWCSALKITAIASDGHYFAQYAARARALRRALGADALGGTGAPVAPPAAAIEKMQQGLAEADLILIQNSLVASIRLTIAD